MTTANALHVRPDVGGMLHLIFTPGLPIYSIITPAPMIHDSKGRPVHVDLDKARRENPGCSLVSFRPADFTSTLMSLASGGEWITPTRTQQRLIHAAIHRAMHP